MNVHRLACDGGSPLFFNLDAGSFFLNQFFLCVLLVVVQGLEHFFCVFFGNVLAAVFGLLFLFFLVLVLLALLLLLILFLFILVFLVVLILILLLLGALPTWPYSSGWGYYPSGGLGLVLVILLVLLLMGKL